MSAVRVRAFVDRLEGDKAVLLLDEKESLAVVWPKSLLPSDAAEGTVLEVLIETDAEATIDVSGQIRNLLKDLGERDR